MDATPCRRIVIPLPLPLWDFLCESAGKNYREPRQHLALIVHQALLEKAEKEGAEIGEDSRNERIVDGEVANGRT